MNALAATILVVLIAGQQQPASRPTIVSSRPAVSSSQTASSPAGPRIVDFGDGIRINYIDRQVEVAGEVILREGPLELFAWSKAPAPKDHESIVLVRAKPQRVFMALGLIGATPGKPLRWFPETQTLREPTGDPIDVLVRYKEGARERTVSAVEWMLDASTRKPMPRTHWLFCGSEQSESGEFMANVEGTLVTVVDFTTSLLALPQRHSDANEELWLMANDEAIPPRGTPVTLLLRPISTKVQLRDLGAAEIEMNGRRLPRTDVAAALKQHTAGWMDRAIIVLDAGEGGNKSAETLEKLRRELLGVGFASKQLLGRGESNADKPGPEWPSSSPAAGK